MAAIAADYLQSLAPVYKDVLAAFPSFDPTRMDGEGLAFQSLFSVLSEKYSLGEVRAACLELAKGAAMEIRNNIFAHPTEMGEELIEAFRTAPIALAVLLNLVKTAFRHPRRITMRASHTFGPTQSVESHSG